MGEPNAVLPARIWSALAGRLAAVIRTPAVALGLCVLIAFLFLGAKGATVVAPRIFDDELRYFDTAASLAAGDGLRLRGQPYRFAPLYPILLAPVMWAAPDRESAYELAKWLNALWFAISAVPMYLLARRIVRPWPSLALAALSVTVPSAMYVSVVMTESLAYLACTVALLAIMLALERPTFARQLSALTAIGVATATRPQFAALFGAYLLGLLMVALLERRHVRGSGVFRPLWPSGIALGLAGVAALAGPLASGHQPRDVLGAYSSVWRAYDALGVASYLLAELANFELYVAVVPLVVAPVVVWKLLREPRTRRDTAFVALFVTVNTSLFVLVASVDSALETLVRPDFQLIHDRYLFYLAPLWVLIVFVWIERGAPRPRGPLAIGVFVAVALPLSLSTTDNTATNGTQHINAMASTLWAGIDFALGSLQFGTRGALLVVVAMLIAAVFLPRRTVGLLPVVVVVAFALTADIGWYLAGREARAFVEPMRRASLTWVDDTVGSNRTVTVLAAGTLCRGWESSRSALLLSEFFNASIGRAAYVGPPPDPLPYLDVQVLPSGHLLLASSERLRATYVLTEPGVRLDGRRLVQATRARLTLWEVRGEVRVQDIRSNHDFERAVCRQRPAGTGRASF
jgi:hypothetical protein